MSYNGGGLNWDQVAAPNFSGVSEGYARGAAMLDNALGKLGEIGVGIGAAQGDAEAKKLLKNIYNYGTGDDLLKARTDGSLFQGVDFSKMSAEQMAGVNQYVKEQYGIDGLQLDNQGKLLGHDLTRAQTDGARASTANTYNNMRINSAKHGWESQDRVAIAEALAKLSKLPEDQLMQAYQGGLAKSGITNPAALKAAVEYSKSIHNASNVGVPSSIAREGLADSRLANSYATAYNNITNTEDQQKFLYDMTRSASPGQLDAFAKATGVDPRSVLPNHVIDNVTVNRNAGNTQRYFADDTQLDADAAAANVARNSNVYKEANTEQGPSLIEENPNLLPKNEEEASILFQAAEQGNTVAQQIVSEITASNNAPAVQQPEQNVLFNQNQTPTSATALDKVMARVPQGVNQQLADTVSLPEPATEAQQQPNTFFDNVVTNATAVNDTGSGNHVVDTVTQQNEKQGNVNNTISPNNTNTDTANSNDPIVDATAQNKAVPTSVNVDSRGNVKDSENTLVKSIAGTNKTSNSAEITIPEADATQALEFEERVMSNPQLAEIVDGMTIGEIINKGDDWKKIIQSHGGYGIANPGLYAAAELSDDLKEFVLGDKGGFIFSSPEYKELMKNIEENPDILDAPFTPEVITHLRNELYGSREDKIDEATKERNKNIEAKEKEAKRKLRESAKTFKEEATNIVEAEAANNPKLNDPVTKARAINDVANRLAYNSMVRDKAVDEYEKNVDPAVKNQAMLANHTKAVVADPNYIDVLAKDATEKADTYLREIQGTTSIDPDKYADVPNDPHSIANAIIEKHPSLEFDKEELVEAIQELGQDPDIKGNYQTIGAVIDVLGPKNIKSGWFNRDGITSTSGRKKVIDLIDKHREFKSSAQYNNIKAYRAELSKNIEELTLIRAELTKIKNVGDKDMEKTAITAINNLVYNIMRLEDKLKPKK